MRTKTTDEFKKEIYDLVGNDYSILSDYKGKRIKVKLKHNVCGHIYEVNPETFLRGSRCMKCRKGKMSNEEFKRKVFEQVGDEYTFLKEYINIKTKLPVFHSKCGNTYETTPNNFLSGHRCKFCDKRKDNETFLKQVKELTGEEYTFLEPYVTGKTKITVLHNKCKRTYKVAPSYFLVGKRCPYCKESLGEKRIYEYLKKNKIPFKRQKKFKQCRNINELPFDFFIKYNNQNILIEFDGKQHFHLENSFGSSEEKRLENFKKTQTNDRIKNEFVEKYSHKIKLLRIRYDEYEQIENILDNYLEQFNDYYVPR